MSFDGNRLTSVDLLSHTIVLFSVINKRSLRPPICWELSNQATRGVSVRGLHPGSQKVVHWSMELTWPASEVVLIRSAFRRRRVGYWHRVPERRLLLQ